MRNFRMLSFVIFLFSYLSSCVEQKSLPLHIVIDLKENTESIRYSQFAQSVDYIELNTNDSCLISDISKIFLDEDTLIVLDQDRAGVLVFTKDGRLVKQINDYGNGPNEFVDITAFALDSVLNQICIFDWSTQRIMRYSYNGVLLSTYHMNSFVRDFAVLNDEINLCFLPFYSKELPYGVWLSDTNSVIVKRYDTKVPADYQFEFIGTNYVSSNQGILYYDRNWDNISAITKDTLEVLYEFDLKQRMPEDLRKKDPASIRLDGLGMMSNFSSSDQYILLSYYFYEGDGKYKWVLIDKNSGKTIVSNRVENDIDSIQTSYHHIYQLNSSTWCRVLDADPDDCQLKIQLLNLK